MVADAGSGFLRRCASSDVRDVFSGRGSSLVEAGIGGKMALSLEAASFRFGRLRFLTKLIDFWNRWNAAVGVFGSRGLPELAPTPYRTQAYNY